ncbi:MAG: hypothetical protein BWX77_01569 [Bacteroidetes bacterium ADurb.Bin090]|nr:MAG: hypothetical protein BWX77_01569 [Bacteroidetes bacterium ADurb.Bin090]
MMLISKKGVSLRDIPFFWFARHEQYRLFPANLVD